jgi:predicted nucleic acid-binding protein
LNSDFVRILRRLKPEKRRRRLKPRKEIELPFLGSTAERPQSLLYDTTVYADILQGRFPAAGEITLRAANAWHSSVVENELAATCGLLDPAHSETRNVIRQITDVLDRIPSHRIIVPDREIWRAAGILAGVIARLQGLSKPERRRILNDALIFETGRKFGHTVLTRNVTDFDLLHQLDPGGRLLFYRM